MFLPTRHPLLLAFPFCALLGHLACSGSAENSVKPENTRQTVAAGPFTVAFLSGLGGTLEGTLSQTVPELGDCTAVKAIPGTGYKFKQWTGKDFTTSTQNPLVLTKVDKNLELTAEFESAIPTPQDSPHLKHMALPKVECTACHSQAMPGVTFPTNYNAKSGPASFDAQTGTCANVSCHGGVTTPTWKTGKIDTNTQCQACHVSGTTQYNGYVGLHYPAHDFFLDNCSTCHDNQKLAEVHFTNLQTPVIEGKAGLTIAGNNQVYDVNAKTCITYCHGDKPIKW